MALEPVTITAEEAPNEELLSMTRHVSLLLDVAPRRPRRFSWPPWEARFFRRHRRESACSLCAAIAKGWLELLLATPVVLWAGAPFFERGWTSLVTRQLNMFTLIAIGTGAAYAYSLLAGAVAPGIFPAAFSGPAQAKCRCISKLPR